MVDLVVVLHLIVQIREMEYQVKVIVVVMVLLAVVEVAAEVALVQSDPLNLLEGVDLVE